ncbi:uncharacterized protein TNCV_3194681 [Trichonephila clavipes]|uniref:Uncharacterized protein n=1 Tax=Trichonephila clavipes TaxID=2585209 RepID=A0A8X6R9K9_TRICX|nr:uncharacterized protein TNCV_3194681 [Trichonephila clavipes]
MPKSPSQMIPDMLDWRQIWGPGKSRKESNSLVPPLPCNGIPYHHTSCVSGVSLKIKGRIETLTTGSPHTAAVQFPRARHHSKRRCRWMGVKGSIRNRRHDPKCPSTRHLRMVRENTGAPSEGATCAWMGVDEAVGYTRAFLMMWRSSRRLPDPGLRVNDISRIHWSLHLLTTQSEQPN